MSNKLCKCGKVAEISCPHDDRCGNPVSNDNKLPEELQKQIEVQSWNWARYAYAKAHKQTEESAEYIQAVAAYSRIAGATEYAQKYQKAKTLLERMCRQFPGNTMQTFLSEKFYNEIKSFLDGSK